MQPSIKQTWVGTAEHGSNDTLRVKIVVTVRTRSSIGRKVTGKIFFRDPVTKGYLAAGSLSGRQLAKQMRLTTKTGLTIVGKLSTPRRFVGEITFLTGTPDELKSSLLLRRSPN